MIKFLNSKPFLISASLFSILFIGNIVAIGSSTNEIILAIFKSIISGIVCGIVVGGIIYLIQKRNERS